MLHLPENLKKYRIMKNLTQEDVATYLRITPPERIQMGTWRVLPRYYLSACTGQYI